MEKTSIKALRIVCYVSLVCMPLWVLFYGIQSYFVLTTGSGDGVINWDSPRIGVKVALFVMNRITIVAMAGLFGAFVVNILRYLKNGVIFNRVNVVLLWVMVAVLPVYSFVSDNMGIACTASEHFDVVLTDNPFVYTVVALIVALLYKMGYDAAEEQKLTI